jgi:hypothetical protein
MESSKTEQLRVVTRAKALLLRLLARMETNRTADAM